ncbi:MAG: choice-of-anchor Q domain-containing protein [Bacteroidota bacterium]|jgi:hypothetical protein
MRFFKYLIFTVIVLISVVSCKKDDILKDSSAKLDFSQEEVLFDTVFTTIGSTTQILVIYNKNSRPLLISSVTLAGGASSPYRLNLDGLSGKSFFDVEIPGDDSLFLFVEVTIDPNNSNTPFIVQDSIVFSTNGNIQDVDLIAFGQDANFIVADRAIQTANGYLPYALLDTQLNKTIVWDDTRPYVVWGGYAVVDSTQTLIIEEGTRVYFGNSAGLWVYRYGTLKVQGVLQNPVVFQGVRRESYYQDVPGQWDRIWINEGSTGNEINYAEIRNPFIGIQAESLFDTFPPKKLKVTNTKITNASGFSLFTRYYNVEVKNSLLARAGQYSVALTRGGGYKFLHTTIANYWNSGQRSTPSVYLSDYALDQAGSAVQFPLYKADFENCIIWGENDEELELDFEFGTNTHRFKNVLLKTELQLSAPSFISIIQNQNPQFESYVDDDYRLRSTSPALNAGDATLLDPDTQLDITGFSRLASPDLGAYERQ